MWGVSWLRAGLGQSLWDSSARLYAASSPPAARVGLLERQWQGCERKQKHARVIESWAQNWHKVTSSARVHAQLLSRVRLSVTPWTVACQAPLSLGFSRQENWRGLPCPPSADLPDAGMEAVFLTSPALAYRFFTTSTTWEALHIVTYIFRFFSMISYYKMLNIAPVLYSKS